MWDSLKEFLARLFQSPMQPCTSGPPLDEHPPVSVGALIDSNYGVANPPQSNFMPSGFWSSGWWVPAVRRPANPGRVGGSIIPRAVVVHTTDTVGGFEAIANRLVGERGEGSCCHFMIGRTPDQGVLQFVPVTKNANHAGGRVHGNWVNGAGLIHPNTVSVGIEILAGGRLKGTANGPIHPDTGRLVPLAEVYWDERGKPWHSVTPYQFATLQRLLTDLQACLKPMPPNWTVVPDGKYADNGVAYYAGVNTKPPVIVGHVTLDPINKLDPGPQVMAWLAEYVKERHG